jgi:immunity protein 35 of polymorphic toxin system
MTEDDARRVATLVLSERFPEFRTRQWVLDNVDEYETAWAFTYNDRRFVESGELRHAVAGNGALVVPKSGAEPWFARSGADTASQVAIGRSALDR